MKTANLGTIIHGTHRMKDLLPALSDELEYQIQRNADEWCSDQDRMHRDRLLRIVWTAREVDPDDDDSTSSALDDLMWTLNEFAPPYGYFGAHIGDGSDYGYWIDPDALDEFDGLRVDDTSEVPDDYTGEVLHVNDHGNVTLYAAQNGQLSEIWAMV